MKKTLTLIFALTLILSLSAPALAADGTVRTLSASNIGTGSVTVSGTTAGTAVAVEVLNGSSSLALNTFQVSDGSFTGTITGLKLTAGTTYTLRAANYSGGIWKTTAFSVPASSVPSVTSSCTITAIAGVNGMITPAGNTSVLSGADKTYTIMPDKGYRISDVLVDGTSVGAVGTYTFEKVQKAHTIKASFQWDNPFTDVSENDWFYDSVEYVYLNKLFEGVLPTAFAPQTVMTRGMLVTVLWRIDGKPVVADTSPFQDVAVGSYCRDAVLWAEKNDIIDGYATGKFGPGDQITREQMAAILYRYANYKGYDTTQGGMEIREFDDYESIADYARTAMTWAVNTQLIHGSNNKLLPGGGATRCQVAAILSRFCEKYVK